MAFESLQPTPFCLEKLDGLMFEQRFSANLVGIR